MNTSLQSIFKKWQNRSCYALPYKENIAPLPFSWLFAGILCTIALVVIRSWPHFLLPSFYVEDAIHYFNYFYGDNRQISEIFQNPRGYYNVFSSLAGWLIAKTDILIQPLLYHLAALSMGLLASCAFSFSGLIRNKILLFTAPLLLGLSGMNHVFYYITITLQIYVVVIFALCLLFYRTKPSGILSICFFVLLTFLIWSGPYSVLVVPFAILYILLFRDHTIFFLLVIGATLAYTLTVNSGMARLEHLINPYILTLWAKALILNIFFMGMKSSVNLEKILLLAAFFLTIYSLLYRDRFFIKTSLLFLAIIILNFAPFLLSLKIIVYKTFMPAHFHIAQFFWLAFLLFTADRLALRFSGSAQKIGIAFAAGAFCFITVDNFEHPEKYRYELYPATPRFVAKVKELEQQKLAEKNQQVIVETPGTLVMISARVGDQTEKAQVKERIVIH